MATMQNPAFERFRDVRNRLAIILRDLAGVAEERKETIVDRQSVKAQTHAADPKRPLAAMLNERVQSLLEKNAFRLAVVGEFNSGKSTLINALLERDILTSSWKPTTAALTILRYGAPERFRVVYLPETGRATITSESNSLQRDLASFTADTSKNKDPELMSGQEKSLAEEIKEVQVWCTADFLQEREIEIIDTPGLGSVFAAHKTVTYELIPNVDATLFLFPMDPGVGEEEIIFLRFIREYVNQVFFVMTKADTARDPREREERADYNKSTIDIKADIQVEFMFPVSAKRVLENNHEDSGFDPFLDALQTFLIRSGGVARLSVPMGVAHTQWGYLSDAVGRDIRLLDESLTSLREELERLKQEQVKIEYRQRDLLKEVDTRIQEMVYIATDGIDFLPTLLQQNVENAINGYNILEMPKADTKLQLIMKETITKWLETKRTRFESSADLLTNRVESGLRDILNTIDMTTVKVEQQRTDIVAPMQSGSFLGRMAGISAGASIKGGAVAASAIGGWFLLVHFGVITAAMFAAFPITWPVLLGAAGILGAIAGGSDLIKLRPKLLNRIKTDLTRPLPKNTVNVYQAMVEGYVKDGKPVNGMRQNVTESFSQWGNDLKANIEEIIANLVHSRIEQLQAHIAEKESGRWDREKSLEIYQAQKIKLDEIGQRLGETEAVIESLRNIEQEGIQ